MIAIKPKQWFTLFEIIIVIGIVSILFLVIQSGFQIPNSYKTQAQWCLQHSYGLTQSFLYAWLTQKSLEENIFPERYTIVFDTDTQTIQTTYNTSTVYETINLNEAKNIWCHNNNYQVVMTGWLQTVSITDTSMTADQFTGNVNFLLCTIEDCLPLGIIQYDTRIQQLRLYLCPDTSEAFCSS